MNVSGISKCCCNFRETRADKTNKQTDFCVAAVTLENAKMCNVADLRQVSRLVGCPMMSVRKLSSA